MFWDMKARRKRSPGDVFTANDDRASELESKLPQHVTVTYDAPVDYSKMSVKELKAIADERGIAYARSTTKAKLIAILEG